jgi:hypothetical protein
MPCCVMGSIDTTTRRYQMNPRHSSRQCTEVWNINKCLREGPPEAIPAAAAAQKAMQANIIDTGHINMEE